MQLPHFLAALTHADRFAAPGGQPTWGDALQAVGNDMMNHARYGTNDPRSLQRLAMQQHEPFLPGQFGSNPSAYPTAPMIAAPPFPAAPPVPAPNPAGLAPAPLASLPGMMASQGQGRPPITIMDLMKMFAMQPGPPAPPQGPVR